MTYQPPFARMRQIKRDASRYRQDSEPVQLSERAPSPEPANVTEALAQTPPEAVYVIEEPEPVVTEKTVELPVVTVEEPAQEPVLEPVLDETGAEPAKYHPQMKKGDLVVAAANLGITVTDEMTKAQILEALKTASAR